VPGAIRARLFVDDCFAVHETDRIRVPVALHIEYQVEPVEDARAFEAPGAQRLVDLRLSHEFVEAIEGIVVADEQYLANVVSNGRQAACRGWITDRLGL